jgi:uncharacterized protein
MVHLLDVNVLLALAWQNHTQHAQARQWFLANSDEGWATCPFTESGFVRLSANPKVFPTALTPVNAVALLRQVANHPNHQFWQADVEVTGATYPKELLRGHKQVADAYLVAMAVRHQGRLVTFDAAIRTLDRTGTRVFWLH